MPSLIIWLLALTYIAASSTVMAILVIGLVGLVLAAFAWNWLLFGPSRS